MNPAIVIVLSSVMHSSHASNLNGMATKYIASYPSHQNARSRLLPTSRAGRAITANIRIKKSVDHLTAATFLVRGLIRWREVDAGPLSNDLRFALVKRFLRNDPVDLCSICQ